MFVREIHVWYTEFRLSNYSISFSAKLIYFLFYYFVRNFFLLFRKFIVSSFFANMCTKCIFSINQIKSDWFQTWLRIVSIVWKFQSKLQVNAVIISWKNVNPKQKSNINICANEEKLRYNNLGKCNTDNKFSYCNNI